MASKISVFFHILCILFSFQGAVYICKSSVFVRMYLPFFHSITVRVFGQSPPKHHDIGIKSPCMVIFYTTISIAYSLSNTPPASNLLPYSRSSRLPVNPSLSHLPYQGSIQINGAFLPAGDHIPRSGVSNKTERYALPSASSIETFLIPDASRISAVSYTHLRAHET